MTTEKDIQAGLNGNAPPVVKCWQIGPNAVAVLCPHCGLYHHHGWRGLPFSDPDGGGHRVADCLGRGGDGDGGGYFLAPDPKPAIQQILRSLGGRRPAKPPTKRAGDEHLRAWIAASCRRGVGCVAVPSDLFASWKAWATANGFGVGDFLRFKFRVEKLGFPRECGRPWFTGLELIEPGPALVRFQRQQANRSAKNGREVVWFRGPRRGGGKSEAK